MERNTFKALAFDLGASSGRAVLGVLCGNQFTAQEIHRFANIPVQKDGHLRWNFSALLHEIERAMQLAGTVDSVGFDTWGVDFGLIAHGSLLEDPVHYRDPRTNGGMEAVLAKISREELYAGTGNQIMPINTLFQLAALKEENPALLQSAEHLLFMPDLFAYSLCGTISCNETIASTGQLFHPVSRSFDLDLLARLSLPQRLFPPTVKSGAVIGKTTSGTKVVSVGHDTECAAALSGGDAFLSCGTWSLIGTEIDAPILSRESMELALSNEIGADGKIQYLKNIVGLWILQECKRIWSQEEEIGFEAIAREASCAVSESLIDPDAPEFSKPCDMPARIGEYCRKSGQREPKTRGEIARCVYESLALKYRYALEQLERMTGRKFRSLQILGGGARAELLCRLTADFTGIPVLAGPAEATSLGNLLIQLSALSGNSFESLRSLLKNCDPVSRYEPRPFPARDELYARFLNLMKKS